MKQEAAVAGGIQRYSDGRQQDAESQEDLLVLPNMCSVVCQCGGEMKGEIHPWSTSTLL